MCGTIARNSGRNQNYLVRKSESNMGHSNAFQILEGLRWREESRYSVVLKYRSLIIFNRVCLTKGRTFQ